MMMIWRLGTIMVTPRKRAFRFSGSSWRPAYLRGGGSVVGGLKGWVPWPGGGTTTGIAAGDPAGTIRATLVHELDGRTDGQTGRLMDARMNSEPSPRVHGDEEAHARVEADGAAVGEHERPFALPDRRQDAVYLDAGAGQCERNVGSNRTCRPQRVTPDLSRTKQTDKKDKAKVRSPAGRRRIARRG